MFGVAVWIQAIVMIAVSIALLLLFLRWIKPRFVKGKHEIVATNVQPEAAGEVSPKKENQ